MTRVPTDSTGRARARAAACAAADALPREGARGPARAAGLAMALAALSLVVACKGEVTADAAPAPADAASRVHVGAPVPPPPVISALPSEASPASAPIVVAAGPSTPAADLPAAAGRQAFDPRRLADARADLDGLLARGARCSADSECRTVAVGGKSCGGPTGYRAYSAKSVDPQAVESLASTERQLSQDEAHASGRVSPCFMLADPGARCVANRCVTGSHTLEPPPAPAPASAASRSSSTR